jgi:hypothetical protein
MDIRVIWVGWQALFLKFGINKLMCGGVILKLVMPGLVPGIHVLHHGRKNTWMAGGQARP